MTGRPSIPRFVVTEISGYTDTSKLEGLTAHVIDRPYNCRVVASYRSEDIAQGGVNRRTSEMNREEVRRRAREHAERLNAAFDR